MSSAYCEEGVSVIRFKDSETEPMSVASIVADNRDEVRYKVSENSSEKSMGAEEVETIVYSAMPAAYFAAEDARNLSDYAGAISKLKSLGDISNPNVSQYVLYLHAYCAFMDGQHSGALSELDELLTNIPETRFYYEAMLLKGRVLLESGEASDAIDYFEECASSFSSVAKGATKKEYEGLAKIWSAIALEANGESQRETERVFGSCQSSSSKRVSLFAKVGIQRVKMFDAKEKGTKAKKNWRDVLSKLKKLETEFASESGVDDALAYLYLTKGETCEFLEDSTEAAWNYSRVIAMFPHAKESYVQALWASVLIYEKRQKEGIASRMYAFCLKELKEKYKTTPQGKLALEKQVK